MYTIIFVNRKKNNDSEIHRFFLQYKVLFRRMIEKENLF